MTRPARLLAALLAAALALVAVSVAGAADKPAPCATDKVIKDPSGDQTIGFAGNQTPIPADPSTDITQFWFNRTADGTTTANVSLANLTPGAPPGSLGLIYRFFYTYKGTDRYAEVDIGADGSVTYDVGTFAPTPTSDGAASGTVVAGADGVVSIRLPSAAGGVEGGRFSNAYVVAAYNEGAVLAGADYAPDSGSTAGIAWDGSICGGSASAVPLALSVKPTSLKARKAKKGAKAKKTTFTVTTGEPVTDVVAKLKKGSKVIGTAKVAKIDTKAKISFKLKSLKKGKYTLSFAAKRADGTAGTATASVTVR